MEREDIINKICEKQVNMIVNNPSAYESDEYKNLELLKISIKASNKINKLKEIYSKVGII